MTEAPKPSDIAVASDGVDTSAMDSALSALTDVTGRYRGPDSADVTAQQVLEAAQAAHHEAQLVLDKARV